ncbi:MAG: helix-turn-helix domain-containing protein [Paludibaculum sp.]
MILQEALRLFARQGVDSVTVREIGDKAGYTNAALFKFFPTKDSLALYLFERCYLAMYEDLSAAVESETAFLPRFHALIAAFTAQLERDPDAFLFVQDQLRNMWPRVSSSTRRHTILGLIRRTLEQGLQENNVRSTADLTLLVATIVGTIQQFARMLSFGEFSKPAGKWTAELEQILLRAVAP